MFGVSRLLFAVLVALLGGAMFGASTLAQRTTEYQPYANAGGTMTPTATVTPADTATATATPVPPSTPTPTTTCVLPFSDVPPEYWANGYIKWAYCNGIVNGYADNTFRPDNSITRGQLAKMVVLAAGYPLVLPPGAPHFSDVPAANPFYLYIEVAQANGVVNGYGDGTYRPYTDVTRAQLAKMIIVARGYVLVNPPNPTFSDVPPDHWAYQFIETADNHQVAGGYSDGTYRPDNAATRAQLCKMLFQAFGLPNLK